MSRRSPGGLGTFVAVSALLVLGLGLFRLLALRFATGDDTPPYSTLRSDPLGMRVLYEALRALPGIAVSRNLDPADPWSHDPQATVFVAAISSGFTETTDPTTIETVRRFVAAGGRLVLTLRPGEGRPRAPSRTSPRTQSRTRTRPRKTEQADLQLHAEEKPGLAAILGFDLEPNVSRAHGADEDVPDEGVPDGDVADGDAPDDAEEPAQAPDDEPDAQNSEERPEVKPTALEPEHAVLETPIAQLPAGLSWHGDWHFADLRPAWRVLYRHEGRPVLVERPFGKGTVVIATDSYFLSNEALRDEPLPGLLAWLIGKSRKVIFDETHLGVGETPGVATLARRYRLDRVVWVLLVLFGLFVWRSSSSFLSRVVDLGDGSAGAASGAIAGRESHEGLVNLLRRSLTPKDVLKTGIALWKARAVGTTKNLAEMHKLVDNMKPGPRGDDPVALYKTLCRLAKGEPESQRRRGDA